MPYIYYAPFMTFLLGLLVGALIKPAALALTKIICERLYGQRIDVVAPNWKIIRYVPVKREDKLC